MALSKKKQKNSSYDNFILVKKITRREAVLFRNPFSLSLSCSFVRKEVLVDKIDIEFEHEKKTILRKEVKFNKALIFI